MLVWKTSHFHGRLNLSKSIHWRNTCHELIHARLRGSRRQAQELGLQPQQCQLRTLWDPYLNSDGLSFLNSTDPHTFDNVATVYISFGMWYSQEHQSEDDDGLKLLETI